MSEYDGTWIHRQMLNDRIRTAAFRDAIEKTVKPGDMVADVGAGTGILSLFAARAGAARVYAIERTPTIEQAKAIAKANGMQDQIEFIWAEALKAKLPEKVDVIVSEWLGHGGLDEDMFPAPTSATMSPGLTVFSIASRKASVRMPSLSIRRWIHVQSYSLISVALPRQRLRDCWSER